MSERGLVLTGACARFSIEGVPVMYSLSVNYGEKIDYEPVEPLDQFDVAEFVPTRYRVSLSAQIIRVIKSPIKLRDGVRLFPTLESILDAPEMTASIEDRKTGTLLANIQRVKLEGYDVAVGNSITLMNCQLNAVRVRDESEIT